jgi:hypothetical protein
VYGLELTSTQSSGDEGGQLNLAKAAANTTLAGNVVIDIFQNKLRFFEGGGTARGAYIDLTSAAVGVGTNLLSGSVPTSIVNGTSNIVVASNGNVTVSVAGTSNSAIFTTAGIVANSIAATNNGNATNFKVGDDAWLGDINTADTIGIRGQQNAANAYIVFGNADNTQLGRAGSGPLTYGGAFSATGNITGGNLSGTNITGTLATAAQTNITSVGTLGSLSVTGNVQGGNLRTGGLISATGDITSAGNVAALNFNSTSADLAEKYEADADYAPGTVVIFGGTKEITVSNTSHNTAVAGIISTAPSYLMNAGQAGEWVLPVALTGRVPCQVQGPVNKGTVLVTGSIPGTAMALDVSKFEPGCIVGKSLEVINSTDVATIEVAVGRL